MKTLDEFLRKRVKTQSEESQMELAEALFKFINIDRAAMKKKVLRDAAHVFVEIIAKDSVLGRPMHPDALIAMALFMSLIFKDMRNPSMKMIDGILDNMKMERDPDDDMPFAIKYAFDETGYGRLIGEIVKEMPDGEAFMNDIRKASTDLAAAKKAAGVDVPDQIKALLSRLGIDVNKV